jgi:uncharacterized protein (TIGR03435 family)
MFQKLLGDRFELKMHRESRELPVHALIIGRRPQLTKNKRMHCRSGLCALNATHRRNDWTFSDAAWPSSIAIRTLRHLAIWVD